MRVKAIMMPFSKLACISVENTVEEAVHLGDFARKPRVTEPYMSTI